ncbi:3-phosphoshikimate 1-carboxyvinyltransferase [Sulfolobales archaeon HS-7]|nr:3-phosphoshikimate 1-carboxyvinyltransferase [Sulfolobales archaeon HS-7]
MIAEINPSIIQGSIKAPQSKSIAIRLILASVLTDIKLENLALSNDVLDALDAVNYIKGGCKGILKLRGSATTLRMIIPIMGAFGCQGIIDGESQLKSRPLSALLELRNYGIEFSSNHLPIKLYGKLRDTEIEVDGSESSQHISGLIYSLLLMGGGKISIKGKMVSKSYVNLTAHLLRSIGARIKVFENQIEVEDSELKPYRGSVPGDYLLSSFYAAGSALTGGRLEITGLYEPPPFFGDHSIVDVFKAMGIRSSYTNSSWIVDGIEKEVDSEFNVEDAIDTAMSIAAVASGLNSTIGIEGTSRLRIKESDRVNGILELAKFGVKIEVHDEKIRINGSKELTRSEVNCNGDHRVGMMLSVPSVMVGGIIREAECVNKSNPSFWDTLRALGGDVSLK